MTKDPKGQLRQGKLALVPVQARQLKPTSLNLSTHEEHLKNGSRLAQPVGSIVQIPLTSWNPVAQVRTLESFDVS